MCMGSSVPIPGTSMNSVAYHKRKSKTHNHLRIPGLSRRRRSWREDQREEKQMEINNWKLYMENQIILQENEKLRKKALLLRQENQALVFLLHDKLSATSHHQEKDQPPTHP